MSLDVDRVLFTTGSVTIGAFRCPVDHPSFHDSGPIKDDCFVFPRTSVEIAHSDARPFVADPTIVTLYNRRQTYQRRPVSRDGDRCDWYAVAAAILRDAVAGRDPAAADHERPIRFTHAAVDSATYYAQRRLFAGVRQPAVAATVDALAIEEQVVALLDRVLEAAYRSPARRGATPDRARAIEIAEAAKRFVAPRVAQRLTLTGIAAGIGGSVFHLCRSFRRATGQTVHGYRDQLRLRVALERIENGERDLTRLALDLGYSSHSHFTAGFRQSFSDTPSRARRALAAATARCASFR
jgi:AraC family transcriptional regulator